MQPIQLGRMRVHKVHEMDSPVPLLSQLPGTTADDMRRLLGWYDQPDEVNADPETSFMTFSVHSWVIEIDGKTILIDTCCGNDKQREILPDVHMLKTDYLGNLRRAGFAPEDIDLVMCTHLHFDHVGWNTKLENGKWVPTFPNARYLLSKPEFQHWNSATDEVKSMSSAVTFDDAVTPLFEFGVVDLVEMDHRVSDTVELVPTPGHSPGHVSVRISSQGETAFITGDCVHSAVQLAEPDWHTMVDSDGAMSSATRRELIAEYADQPVLIIGTHFPPPTAGHLVITEKGVRFQPLQ